MSLKTGRLTRFLGVGAVGFGVDFSTLAFCLEYLKISVISARSLAFATAILCTWLLNRRITFADRISKKTGDEFVRYFAASVSASIANLSVYALIVVTFSQTPGIAYVAMPIGVLTGLSINYWLYNKVVFRPNDDP